MRALGMWRKTPLPPEKFEFKEAFAQDTMTFAQWLQFVFLPRVREEAAERRFPKGSMVGALAIHEFDGWTEGSDLVSLLCEFDDLF